MTGPLTSVLYWANRIMLDVSAAVVGMTLDGGRDVVLITGGSGGLGRELAIQFYQTGARVVVFDVVIPPPDSPQYVEGVHYYVCDVSDRDSIGQNAVLVEKEVGSVTILVNNAGITTGKTLLQLTYAQIEKTMAVNLLSSFYTIKTFLPNMLANRRGYVVTVASTLGYMSPARLSAYGASKSGLIALHESLTYELGPPTFNTSGVKTLLICPGQLKTSLFEGVKTPHSLLAPELEPAYVAKQVVRALKLGKRGEIRMPFYGNFLPLFRSVPWPLVQVARYMSGIDQSMLGFAERVHSATTGSATLLRSTAERMGSFVSFAQAVNFLPSGQELNVQHGVINSAENTGIN